MVLADDRILEYLDDVEAATPSEMIKDGFVRYSSGYVSQRCSELVKHGLIKRYGQGVYMITDRGREYLRGEIDTSEDAPDEVPSTDDSSGPTEGDNHEQA